MSDLARWQVPFIDLKRQFEEAANQGLRPSVLLCQFLHKDGPAHLYYDIDREWRASHLHLGQEETFEFQSLARRPWRRFDGSPEYEGIIVYGEPSDVHRFQGLGEAAGACLAGELHPSKPFHDGYSKPMEADEFERLSVWVGFVFRELFDGGQSGAFTFQERLLGTVVATLDINPFIASALAAASILDGRALRRAGLKSAEAPKPKGTTPPPNGPSERKSVFYWNGESFKLTPKSWELAREIWKKDGTCFADVGDTVWGSDATNPQTIRSAVSRLNNELLEHDIPVSWECSNEAIWRVAK